MSEVYIPSEIFERDSNRKIFHENFYEDSKTNYQQERSRFVAEKKASVKALTLPS